MEGKVQITNPSNYRSILFIEDLVAYIGMMLDLHQKKSFPEGTTQVALGSWSGSIGSLGAEIARFWGAEKEFGPDSGTYSFVISDRELRKAFGSRAEFYMDISARCERFAQQNGWELK